MFSKRWDYWIRTCEEGKVLEEPIPQIKWLGHPEPEAQKNIEDCLSYASSRLGSGTFDTFVDWFLYGLGDEMVKEFPSRVDKDTNSYWYRKFSMGLMMKHPYDYLGQMAADTAGSGKWSNPTAFFPTPMDVCTMMTKMTMQDADRTASVCDPAVGSGRFLLTASNYSLNLYGCDIDPQILKVCKANLWMYVPWAIAPRPELEGMKQAGSDGEGKPTRMPPVQQVTPEVQQELLKQGGSQQLGLF